MSALRHGASFTDNSEISRRGSVLPNADRQKKKEQTKNIVGPSDPSDNQAIEDAKTLGIFELISNQEHLQVLAGMTRKLLIILEYQRLTNAGWIRGNWPIFALVLLSLSLLHAPTTARIFSANTRVVSFLRSEAFSRSSAVTATDHALAPLRMPWGSVAFEATVGSPPTEGQS